MALREVRLSAIKNTLSDRSGPLNTTNASEAIVPVPLATVIKRGNMLYHQFWRQSDAAIYCAKGKGARTEYEVFKIQVLPAGELGGRSYPLRESFPSNSEWGESGWTFTNNSDRDPLATALAKAQEILRYAQTEGSGIKKGPRAPFTNLEAFEKEHVGETIQLLGTRQQTKSAAPPAAQRQAPPQAVKDPDLDAEPDIYSVLT